MISLKITEMYSDVLQTGGFFPAATYFVYATWSVYVLSPLNFFKNNYESKSEKL